MSQQKKQWGAIIVMIALFAMIAFVTNLCTPMATIIKNQGEISNVLAQIGNYGNFVAYLVMGIPAGMLIAKFGYKKTALIGLVVGSVGILIQWYSGQLDAQENLGLVFAVYLVGAFIAGLCMCILNCVVNPMLNLLGGGGNKGNQLIQIGGVFNSSAAVACYILMGALIACAIFKFAQYSTDQEFVQRQLTCKNIKDAARSLVSSQVISLPVVIIFMIIGSLLFIYYGRPDLMGANAPADALNDSRQIFPQYMFNHMPVGVLGLMVVGLLAAALGKTVKGELKGLFEQQGEPLGKGLVLGDNPGLFSVEGVAVEQHAVGLRLGAASAPQNLKSHPAGQRKRLAYFLSIREWLLVLDGTSLHQNMAHPPGFYGKMPENAGQASQAPH